MPTYNYEKDPRVAPPYASIIEAQAASVPQPFSTAQHVTAYVTEMLHSQFNIPTHILDCNFTSGENLTITIRQALDPATREAIVSSIRDVLGIAPGSANIESDAVPFQLSFTGSARSLASAIDKHERNCLSAAR